MQICSGVDTWIMDRGFQMLGLGVLGSVAMDSAGLRDRLCVLPATHIAERRFSAALKLPRLTRDLLSVSVSDTALRVEPLLEGCRSRYDTRRSAKVAFATLFYLGSRAVVTALLIGIGTLIPGPWSLEQCNRRASQRS